MKTWDAEMAEAFADAVLHPKVIGTGDLRCVACHGMLPESPLCVCPCGCDAPMDRLCPTCGGVMVEVRRQ